MRKLRGLLLAATTGACALVAIGLLLGLIGQIAWRGWPALSWSFFTEQIRSVGAAGGIFWNLVGTSLLLLTALVLCAPVATALALIEQVWLPPGRLRSALRLALYTINGLPSIVFGLFGFIVLVNWFAWGKSWLAGGIVLALSMLPTVTLALSTALAAVPRPYLEAAAALGLSREQVVRAVWLPRAAGSLVTGLLLGLARAAGETAPIMFTATIFAGATFPTGVVNHPVLTLSYHIFTLAQDSFDPETGVKVWGAALVLLALVVTLSLLALPARLRAASILHR